MHMYVFRVVKIAKHTFPIHGGRLVGVVPLIIAVIFNFIGVGGVAAHCVQSKACGLITFLECTSSIYHVYLALYCLCTTFWYVWLR